jgi:hypothetical protein
MFYCKNYTEFRLLLLELSKKNQIEITNNNPRATALSLTVEGLQYYESMGETSESDISIAPIIFISYASEELALADFLRNVLKRWFINKVVIFVAKRDIPPGDNPLKVMLEDHLKKAQAIIPICSIKSKNSSWLWWESSAVWAKGNKIYPLFTNLHAGDFGAPLTLVSQGKEFFKTDELIETFKMICNDLQLVEPTELLTSKEIEDLKKLKIEYSKEETSAYIHLDFKKLEMRSEFHKYSLIFEIENKTQRKFDDIIVELLFPIDYIEKKKWEYPGLISHELSEKPGYLNLVFSYNGLSTAAKAQFLSGLLPTKKLRIFGEDGMFILNYEMDHFRWDKRFNFDIQWKVYINGGAPIEGTKPLNEIQYF